jgi:hypothetical protein
MLWARGGAGDDRSQIKSIDAEPFDCTTLTFLFKNIAAVISLANMASRLI